MSNKYLKTKIKLLYEFINTATLIGALLKKYCVSASTTTVNPYLTEMLL